jgi:D-beta-D-heptose 7-phosphate kinase/D-beta-D-heptose 1-phosphate adenosyltransferase
VSRRLVVVGDVLLDVDVLARAERLTPDAPVPVLEELGRELRPGGAALAALLAARDPDTDVTLIAPLPDDDAAAEVRSKLGAYVELIAVPATGRTPVKTRLRVNAQTVTRLDSGGGVEIAAIGNEVSDRLAGADAVLVSDYGGAAARDARLRELLGRFAGPIVWDPHPRGAAPVAGVALATPNLTEALALSGAAPRPSDRTPLAPARRAGETLRARWEAQSVCVTLGARGAILTFGTGTSQYLPVDRAATGDPCGAGDCFAGAAAAALAHGDLPSQAAARAVRSAAAFITGGGVGSLRAADDPAQPLQDPIDRVRASGGTVVATGGCFDLLHAGHIQTLAAARSVGDCLVVLINSDQSVRRIKGNGRPLQHQADRARVLAALRDVDRVIIFDEDTPERALATLRPDVWVKGGDYTASELPESELVRSWGGEVITVGYLDGKSTSTLVQLARQ